MRPETTDRPNRTTASPFELPTLGPNQAARQARFAARSVASPRRMRKTPSKEQPAGERAERDKRDQIRPAEESVGDKLTRAGSLVNVDRTSSCDRLSAARALGTQSLSPMHIAGRRFILAQARSSDHLT